MSRSIKQYPDSILQMKSEEIQEINDNIKSIAKDLEEYIKKGPPGMAAVQLGELVRLIGLEFNNEIVFIVNPIITKFSKQTFTSTEGCLSIGLGDYWYKVKRHKIITVRGKDLEGKEVKYKGRGLFAVAVQHEVDHLEGKLIND